LIEAAKTESAETRLVCSRMEESKRKAGDQIPETFWDVAIYHWSDAVFHTEI
jgi:hypothetical protein